MPRVLRTPASRNDYDEIWRYLAVRNIAAADQLVDEFDAILQALASTPQMGRGVEDLAPRLRSFPVGNYLIFYRPIEDGVTLIRILHGARDIRPEFFAAE